jgi:cyclase
MERDFNKIEVKVTKVAGTVYMLTGSGGRIGVSAGEDGIVIVDDQFAPLAPKIRAALNTISVKPVKFIINTHYHGDHIGGNAIFARTGTIIAHDNVRKRLEGGTPKQSLPIVTFSDTTTVHLNGEDIRAVHFPNGHTDGDAVVYFTRSNVVHMGDDFFNARLPFIDVENGGSVKGLIANIDKILAALPDDVKIIPGHGDLSDKTGLRRFVEMLEATSDVVERAIKGGRPLDQMKADKILAQWDSWAPEGWFIDSDRFSEMLYRDLSRK